MQAVLAAALAMAVNGAPNSDPTNLTMKTQVRPILSDGRLAGCAAEFSVIHTRLDGQASDTVGLSGSVTVQPSAAGEPVMVLKVRAVGPDGRSRPLAAAGLVTGESTNGADLVSSQAADPGALTSIYRLRNASLSALASFTASEALNGYYSVKAGQPAARFTADFRVARLDPAASDQDLTSGAGAQFNRCLARLLQP